MEESRARHLVDVLRARGAPARLARVGVYQFGITIELPDGREAVWDTDGTAGLEAQVLRDGDLVGYVPMIVGSTGFGQEDTLDAILRTDYEQPVARRLATAPPPAAPLPVQGGVFRRFFGGFRQRNA